MVPPDISRQLAAVTHNPILTPVAPLLPILRCSVSARNIACSEHRNRESRSHQEMRSDYKGVWTALSRSLSSAKMHVSGTEDEATIETSGVGTSQFLLDHVGINSTDIVLEIGCGIGRVGKCLAGRCRRWIGADVSPHMLAFAAERL